MPRYDPRKTLAHVLWLGGATDSGKSTIARNLAQRHGWAVYHYDIADAEHHQKLAEVVPEVRQFLEASINARWIEPTPQALFEYLLFSFPLRFQLVIESLLEFPSDKPVIAEGFGFLPELVHPLLSEPHQAIWLVPTAEFKRDSMARRGKPSFAASTSDPEKAKLNLFLRDQFLADYYQTHVGYYGGTVYEVDGSRTIEEMTDLVDAHFARYLTTRK